MFRIEHYSRRTALGRLGLGPRMEHRWRAVARNGRTLASGEGYNNLADLKATCRMLFGKDVVFVEVPK